MALEFRILGPLEAVADGTAVGLGGPRQRAVLAMLLADANEVVPVERVIDGVWDESPPGTAANIVQGYVSQLRKTLGRDSIDTRGRGYVIRVADGALDLHRFERLAAAAAAERSAGRAAGVVAQLRDALALWRGPSLSDLVHIAGVHPIAQRLDDVRLNALEQRLEAELECGNAAQVAAELEALVAAHPLRERYRALQMLALYRCGRQADALDAFHAARRTLVDELGIEPGAELRELSEAILRHDPALTPPPASALPAIDHVPAVGSVLVGALAGDGAEVLAELGAALARDPARELVLASMTSNAGELGDLTDRLRRRRERLTAGGVGVRAAAFTSLTPGADLARLAREQDAALVLVGAPDGLLEDARLLALLDQAPCDVAVVVPAAIGAGPVLVPFSGAEHDWAALEVGAWLARALGRPLQLAGASTGIAGRDASRLLASASLALQRALDIHGEPVIVEPTPDALLAVAADAGAVVVGLTDRWRHEGLGRTRTALAAQADAPTLLIRRGLRPGGLATPGGETQYTWTIVAAR